MPTAQEIARLTQSYFFDALSPEELNKIAAMSGHRSYQAGELVFAEGDPVEAFYLVILGQVQAYKIGADGKELILHLVGPGEVFAEFPVFGNIAAYPAYALCLAPTDLLAIPAEPFKRLVSDNPQMLLKMLARFSQRIKEFNALIEDLSLRSVDSRLAKYLLTLSEQGQTRITVPKKTLAAILGTIPETLSRALKRLKDQGAIHQDGTLTEIRDPGLLAQLANTP